MAKAERTGGKHSAPTSRRTSRVDLDLLNVEHRVALGEMDLALHVLAGVVLQAHLCSPAQETLSCVRAA
jgi:hypothetical protein